MNAATRRHCAPGSRARRGWLGVVLTGLVTVLTLLMVASPAWAHAELVLAAPGDGQVYQESPTELLLQFTEPVTVPAQGVRLFGPNGEPVPTGAPTHRPGDGTSVATPLTGALPDGVYTVAYRVVSADSHPVQGALTFTVGVAALGATAVAPPASDKGAAGLAYGITRWLGFGGLALLIGSCLFIAWCWPAGAAHRRVRATVWTGWAASAVAATGTVLVYGPYAAGLPLADALDPGVLAGTLSARIGVALLVRLGLLVALAAVLAWGLRRYAAAQPERRTRGVVAGGVLTVGAALAATWSLANHSASGEASAAAIPADITHLVAMSAWLGGLTVLALALLPSRDLKAMRTAVPAFSQAAAISVAALLATGLFQTWRQVRTPAALIGTDYGRLLLAKASLVCLLLALGLGARAWTRRHYSTSTGNRGTTRNPDPHQVYHFRRRIAAETTLGVAVLALSAVLVATEPARIAHAATTAAARTPTPAAATIPGTVPFEAGSGPLSRGQVALGIEPPRVGQAALHLSVLDPAGRPLAVPEVRASLRLPARDLGPFPVSLRTAGPGHYIAATTLPLTGRWLVDVTVRTSEVDQTTLSIPVQVTGS
jgi:copper transport protein